MKHHLVTGSIAVALLAGAAVVHCGVADVGLLASVGTEAGTGSSTGTRSSSRWGRTSAAGPARRVEHGARQRDRVGNGNRPRVRAAHRVQARLRRVDPIKLGFGELDAVFQLGFEELDLGELDPLKLDVGKLDGVQHGLRRSSTWSSTASASSTMSSSASASSTSSNPNPTTWDPSWSRAGVTYSNGNLSVSGNTKGTEEVRTVASHAPPEPGTGR